MTMTQTAMYDPDLTAIAAEVATDCGDTPFPFTLSYERNDLGSYIWTAYLENRGIAVEMSDESPSAALHRALVSFRKVHGQAEL